MSTTKKKEYDHKRYLTKKQSILAKNKKYKQEHPTSPRTLVLGSLRMAKRRCTNPNDDSYKSYGGKGIKYLLDDCRREAVAMLLPMYEQLISENKTPSLDRIDSKGHYELSNIRAMDKELNSHCDCCMNRLSLLIPIVPYPC